MPSSSDSSVGAHAFIILVVYSYFEILTFTVSKPIRLSLSSLSDMKPVSFLPLKLAFSTIYYVIIFFSLIHLSLGHLVYCKAALCVLYFFQFLSFNLQN